MKCTNCANEKFKDGFLSGGESLLFYTEGKPGFKNQLLGKRKRLHLRICSNCGYCHIFAK